MTDPIDATTTAPAAGASVSDRALTVPNVITGLRLGCLPIFLWLLFGAGNRAAAALTLLAIGVTDFVDGYIARRFGQVSTLGKILDPVADRLWFFVAGGAILVDGSVPTVFAVAVLIRELAVSAAVLALAAMGARRIDVTWFGKAGTFCLMGAFPLFLLSHSTFAAADLTGFLAWGLGLVGLAFAYYAVACYVPIALSALRDGRRARGLGTVRP